MRPETRKEGCAGKKKCFVARRSLPISAERFPCALNDDETEKGFGFARKTTRRLFAAFSGSTT